MTPVIGSCDLGHKGQRTGGKQRCQPVFSIVFQASMALCLNTL
nr:hypothetical protein [Prochlorococcus marinus]